MEEQIQQVLAEIEASGRENDARETDRASKMLNLHPDTARKLSDLALEAHSTRILEIGTSSGYSLIWLAWAARQNGGHVLSIDRDPAKTELALANLKRAGLTDIVTLRTGDAAEILSDLEDQFDLVFLDADRITYPAMLTQLLSKLTPGALLLADNVNSHPTEIAGYISAISAHEDFEHSVDPVGEGLSIAYYRPE
ncbi:MAG: class I SAM-dependent methyltransferase [Capsulimonas sp.]|uniref:O-methyltransferase n=1 Tax=Capsulimonas sp. TaxID=2494211 RepID=UPI0032671AC1